MTHQYCGVWVVRSLARVVRKWPIILPDSLERIHGFMVHGRHALISTLLVLTWQQERREQLVEVGHANLKLRSHKLKSFSQ